MYKKEKTNGVKMMCESKRKTDGALTSNSVGTSRVNQSKVYTVLRGKKKKIIKRILHIVNKYMKHDIQQFEKKVHCITVLCIRLFFRCINYADL